MPKHKGELVEAANNNLPAHLQKLQGLSGELLDESKGSIEPRLPVIKIAAGGTNQFVRGEDETFKRLECVIIATSKAYAMWIPKDDAPKSAFMELFGDGFVEPEDGRPICSSFDGIEAKRQPAVSIKIASGKRNVFEDCSKCYFNDFGSDLKGGKGKACKNGRRLLVLVKGSSLPNFLTIPPTSIRPFDEYITRLLDMQTPPAFIKTTIELERKESAAGQPYSVTKFNIPEKLEWLDEETILAVEEIRKQFLRFLKTTISEEEFTGNGQGKSKPIDAEVEDISDNVNDETLPF